MTALDPGIMGYLVLLLLGFFAHEPWRWLGLVIGGRINPQGEAFRIVRAVSNAIVAALVMRLLIFPSGALVDVPLWIKLAGLGAGIATFFASGRHLGFGIAAGCIAFLVARAAF